MKHWLLSKLNSLGARCATHFPRLGAALRPGEPELCWVPHLVRKGDVALDIGANWGPYTHRFLRAGCKVIAFEPNQDLARRLARSLPQVQVESTALSNHVGTATLRMPIMGNGAGATGLGSIEAPRGGGINILNYRFRLGDSMTMNWSVLISLKLMLRGMKCPLLRAECKP